MLKNRLLFIRSISGSVMLLIAFIILCAEPALAAQSQGTSSGVQSLSAQEMINRIATQIPQLMRMVTAVGYVIGMYFIFHAFMKLKEFGEQRTMMSQQHHLKEPLTYIVMGALLLYLPTSVQVGTSSFWADPSPYRYIEESNQWQSFINNCFMVIQLVGTIAFIRGLVILGHGGGHGGGQGQFAKGVTHIIGGILCINIYQFVKVILFTVGIQT